MDDNNRNSVLKSSRFENFKEEEIFRHYLRVLAQLLDYFGIPEETREFIEAVAIKLGFDYTPPKDDQDDSGLVRVFDGELADQICASISLKAAAQQRLRRQRKDLWKWQSKRDAEGKRRAQAVDIKRDYDLETHQYTYRYRFPLDALIRDVAALAPVGSSDLDLTATITRQAGEFLRRQGGRKKISRQSAPTPQNQISIAHLPCWPMGSSPRAGSRADLPPKTS